MTVSSSISVVTYNANDVTTVFPVPFPFLTNDSLTVTLITIATGTRATLGIIGPDGWGDYSVTGAGSPSGGSITTNELYATGYQIEIARSTPITQLVDFVNNDGFDADAAEGALDRLTMICQEMLATVSRVVTAAPGAISVANGVSTPPYWFTTTAEVLTYGKFVGSTYYMRRLYIDGYFLADLNEDYAYLVSRNFFDQSTAYVATPNDSCYTAGLQVRNGNGGAGYPLMVLWEGDGAVNTNRWAFHCPSTGVMSIGAMKDDFSAVSEYVQFLRSTFTATAMKQMVLWDANTKRIGNVAALDFDEQDKGDVTGNVTFDFSTYNTIKARFTGNVNATFTAPNGPTTTYLEVTQDGTGSRVITLPAAAKFTAGTAPADKLLSTGANKRDLIALKWNGAGTAALAQIFKDW